MPDADERVLWYRKIASAATEQAVEDVRADLAAKRPDMPQAAKNLLEKARIKAYANEHHIKTVSVTGGKLVVEPIDIARDKMTGLRRSGWPTSGSCRCPCATSSWTRATTCWVPWRSSSRSWHEGAHSRGGVRVPAPPYEGRALRARGRGPLGLLGRVRSVPAG